MIAMMNGINMITRMKKVMIMIIVLRIIMTKVDYKQC